jgi:ATP phosphoribosyltransferase
MARYVESGVLDVGLTGLHGILENESQVEIMSDLVYSKASTRRASWVLAVPDGSDIASLEDCADKRISTELVNFTKRYFAEQHIPVEVEFSWGATEAKVVEGLVDAGHTALESFTPYWRAIPNSSPIQLASRMPGGAARSSRSPCCCEAP